VQMLRYMGNKIPWKDLAPVLETGYTVKVPLFIEVDDVLRIDTRTGQYIERA